MIQFEIPIRLVASTNAREHWRVQGKRKKEQRGLGCFFTRNALGIGHTVLKMPKPEAHLTVTLTRIGKRKMDDDNLATSAKYVRDGIADGLGIDDGDAKMVSWQYAQEIGKQYSCRVTIE